MEAVPQGLLTLNPQFEIDGKSFQYLGFDASNNLLDPLEIEELAIFRRTITRPIYRMIFVSLMIRSTQLPGAHQMLELSVASLSQVHWTPLTRWRYWHRSIYQFVFLWLSAHSPTGLILHGGNGSF